MPLGEIQCAHTAISGAEGIGETHPNALYFRALGGLAGGGLQAGFAVALQGGHYALGGIRAHQLGGVGVVIIAGAGYQIGTESVFVTHVPGVALR